MKHRNLHNDSRAELGPPENEAIVVDRPVHRREDADRREGLALLQESLAKVRAWSIEHRTELLELLQLLANAYLSDQGQAEMPLVAVLSILWRLFVNEVNEPRLPTLRDEELGRSSERPERGVDDSDGA